MIKVLIADDSTTSRDVLSAIFEENADCSVVGMATTGREAVDMARDLQPDVITMDVKMPIMDGLEATRIIMEGNATPIVIVSAHLDETQALSSVKAMELGALALLRKLPSVDDPDFDSSANNLLRTVKAMADVKVVARRTPRSVSLLVSPESMEGKIPGKPEIIAIAASTGGPQAISGIFSNVKIEIDVPIIVTQHIGIGFAPGYVQWLDRIVNTQAKIAENGEILEPRIVYVAPDDRHLGVAENGRIRLASTPAIGGFRPAADFMFESVGRRYGQDALAIILSGMGSDGVEGLKILKSRGGRVIAQDESSSVVFGMPGKTVEAGLSDLVLPPESIGQYLSEVARP